MPAGALSPSSKLSKIRLQHVYNLFVAFPVRMTDPDVKGGSRTQGTDSRPRQRHNFVHEYRYNSNGKTETRNTRHSGRRGAAGWPRHLSATMRSISYAAMTRGLLIKRTSQTKTPVRM